MILEFNYRVYLQQSFQAIYIAETFMLTVVKKKSISGSFRFEFLKHK